MHVIHADNVCEALPRGVEHLLKHGRRESSRDGNVLVAPSPVTTVYHHPSKCVLTNAVRDANPFFHLYEALWILNGQRDAASLNRYVSDFGERFAEEDGRIHGAYGYRLRHYFGVDQLASVIDKLRRDPGTRQAVVGMWDPHSDLTGEWKDRPCNTHIVFSIVEGRLNMMVYNRSNDIIMGAYGANAVHFSFIQQYVAGMLGLPVGMYWQVSYNYHMYARDLDKLVYKSRITSIHDLPAALHTPATDVEPERLVDDPGSFDAELQYFMARAEVNDWDKFPAFKNRFLRETARPMLKAHSFFKKKEYKQAELSSVHILAEDWGNQARLWLSRRVKI